jgi:hypothetical protein
LSINQNNNFEPVDVRFLSLETTDDNLLGSPDQIQDCDRYYYDDLVSSEYISYHEILENKNNICVTYIADNVNYIGLYNKQSKETICGSLEQMEDGLGIKGLTWGAGKIGDYFVIPLFIEILKEHQESGFVYPDELTGIINRTGDAANPVLLLFRLM